MIKLNLAPEVRILRQFAWIAAIAMPVLTAFVTRGTVSWYAIHAWPWTSTAVLWLAGVAVVQLLLLLLGSRQPTQALYVVLMVVAWPIGFVVSHVLIATIYYLVMTPIGLFFRLTGRDVIGRRLDRAATTYWHDRGKPRPASAYFKLY